MKRTQDLAWWYWLFTVSMLGAGLFGWAWGLTLAIALVLVLITEKGRLMLEPPQPAVITEGMMHFPEID